MSKPKGKNISMSVLKAHKVARLVDEKSLLDIISERFVEFCFCGERLSGGKPVLTIKGQSYKMLNMLLSALDYMIVEAKDVHVMAHMGQQFEARANSLRAILIQAKEAEAAKAAAAQAATTGEPKNEQPQGETAAPAPAVGQPTPEISPLQPVQASGDGAGGAEVSTPDIPKQS